MNLNIGAILKTSIQLTGQSYVKKFLKIFIKNRTKGFEKCLVASATSCKICKMLQYLHNLLRL